MRIITWNIKQASRTSDAWKSLIALDPDVALLQEVVDIPDSIRSLFAIRSRTAIKRRGEPQRFGTAVFVKGKILDDLPLTFGSGNAEFLGRMKELGLTECFRAHNRKLIPTFKNSIGGKVIHQIDHMSVTHKLHEGMTNCVTGEQELIFGRSLSDHLPIIADFS